jgi:hypothetical protein
VSKAKKSKKSFKKFGVFYYFVPFYLLAIKELSASKLFRRYKCDLSETRVAAVAK